MKKRTKIVISSVLLAFLFYLANSLPGLERVWFLVGLAATAAIVTVWSLWGEIQKVEFVTILILPLLFTAGLGLFYYLLPGTWLLKAGMAVVYAAGMYILLLTENIFSVAAQRNIQLLRAAQATGFLLTLVTTFFIFDAIFSYRLSPWWNAVLVGGVSWLIIFQGFWTVVLGERFPVRVFFRSGALGLVLAQTALVISFFPLTVPSASLFLTAVVYVLLGLAQSDLQERLFVNTVREYAWIGALVLVTILLTTRWGG